MHDWFNSYSDFLYWEDIAWWWSSLWEGLLPNVLLWIIGDLAGEGLGILGDAGGSLGILGDPKVSLGMQEFFFLQKILYLFSVKQLYLCSN